MRFPGGPPETQTRKGKAAIWFGKKAQELLREYPQYHEVLTLPCGHCISCYMKRATDWAIRCVHEMAFWPTGCFLTLTYATDKLPQNRSLRVEHFQLFMKRLREYLARVENVERIKYFACGEYGDKTDRPHYHAVVFGWKPGDMVEVPNNPGTEYTLYDSKIVADLWTHGRVRIGTLTARSAAYVARYTIKKQYGEAAQKEYADKGRVAPFLLCSQGIGRGYFAKWRCDIYPSDFVVDGEDFQKHSVPRFYDKLLEECDKAAYEAVKRTRLEKASKRYNAADNTPQRLAVREECASAKLNWFRNRGKTE